VPVNKDVSAMNQTVRSVCNCWQRLWISFIVCLGLIPSASAQPSQHLAPSQPAPGTPLTLQECIRIGLEKQPTLDAQRSSVAAAEAQRKALDNMVCLGLISKELPIRKQQACLGVTIADAGLQIAEWDTIYAVTRTYYTALYAKQQETVVTALLAKLEQARKTAEALIKKGDPDVPVKKTDVDKLTVNIDLLQMRLIEATIGVDRATAALREAMGVHYDTPLPLVHEEFPPPIDPLDREHLIQVALSRRGEVVQAQAAAKVAELEVCAQNTGCLVPFKFTFAAASDIHSREIPQGQTNGTYRPSATGIEMPPILVGHKADRVARAQEFSNRAAAVVEKTQNLIALETGDAHYRWQVASAQVKTLRASAVKSANLADLISRDFDNGKVSGEDYLRARTLDDQTQSQLNEALFHYALAIATLERVTAGAFPASHPQR
jgi:outer membrane protein TolC